MGEMEASLRPGISENELWAELHRGNIARGGEWIETRLLSSGVDVREPAWGPFGR